MSRKLFPALAFAVTATALVSLSAAAMADNFPQATIFIVNYGEIQTQSKAAQNVRAQVQALEKSYKARNDAEMGALKADEQKLRADMPKLSEAERAKRQAAFEAKVAAAQKTVQARNRALQQGVEAAGQKISDALSPIFSDIMGKRGGNVLLGTNEVVYFDRSLEITSEVVERLNATLATVKVEIPAAN